MSLAILIGSVLVTLSVVTSLVSFRIGAPLLLVFLLIGLLAGEDGVLGIEFDDAGTAFLVGSLALAIILFDSGFDTRWTTFRSAGWPAIVLATVGVGLTTAILGVAAHHLFGLSWLESFLLAAVVSSTDAAAVFFLLRVGGIAIRERVKSTLEIESGSNDPMAIFLTVALLELLTAKAGADTTAWHFAEIFVQQMGIGAIAGLVGGWLIVRAVNGLDLEPGLYPVIVMSLVLALFAGTSLAGGSGFLAAYMAGVYAGNTRLRATGLLRRFQNGMTWLAQIVMFLLLGLLATPSQFLTILPQAALLALFLILVGRPLAIWLCLLPFGFARNETAFVSWVGLRGAVSILLAIMPIVAGIESGMTIFNAAFVIVLVSLVVQGWTIAPMARRLGLVVPPAIGPVDRVELELPGGATHELVAYRIVADSPVTAGERIPRWARPSLIVRDGRSMRVHKAGRLQAGDVVLIFIAPERVPLLDRLFASPVQLDVGDRAFFGDFTLPPTARIADLGSAYGFAPAAGDQDLTLNELLRQELGGQVETGDRLHYGPVELIVRKTEDGHVTEVGLALDETGRLPVRFQSPSWGLRLRRMLRRWRDRRTRAPGRAMTVARTLRGGPTGAAGGLAKPGARAQPTPTETEETPP